MTEFVPAVRQNVPLLIGLAGGTGSGKTFSAMRIATGLAHGARFAVIDTENGRAKHYADQFEFDVADLSAPFTPAAYADAIESADAAGYPVIVVDSASHEHAGDGGLLDMHDAEFARMGGREAAKMAAWIAPKREHKRMVSRLLQVRAHVILCFRAEEKVEMRKNAQTGRMEVVPKASLTGLGGWIPVSEKNLPYELTLSFLLTADAPGIPKPIKLQEQHRDIVSLEQPVDESVGEALAKWAAGGEQGTGRRVASPSPADREAAELVGEILKLAAQVGADGGTVQALIEENAAKNAGEPAKHVTWLKGQRTRMQTKLDEQGEAKPKSQFDPPPGAVPA